MFPPSNCSRLTSYLFVRSLSLLYLLFFQLNLDLDGTRDMRNFEQASIDRECNAAAVLRCGGVADRCDAALQGRYASHCCVVMFFDAEAILAAGGGGVGQAASAPAPGALQALVAEARNCFAAFAQPFTPLFFATKVDLVRRSHPNFHFPAFAAACAEALNGGDGGDGMLRVTTTQVLEIRGIGSKGDFAALLAQRDWDYVRQLYHKAFAAMLPIAASNMRRDRKALCECTSLCV